ncbi:MAG: hypothetical protein ACOX1S_05285 [Anaerostipes sp.]|jgi:hypothetical protein|nr:hypothetical protein [Anaerostipes sp.]
MIVQWIVIFLLVAYIIYKAMPSIKHALEDYRSTKNHKDNIVKMLNDHEDRLDEHDKLLNRDYIRMNKTDKLLDVYLLELNNTKEENTLIMRGVLASLKGLQGLGINEHTSNSTKKAQEDIEEYLMKQAHEKVEL